MFDIPRNPYSSTPGNFCRLLDPTGHLLLIQLVARGCPSSAAPFCLLVPGAFVFRGTPITKVTLGFEPFLFVWSSINASTIRATLRPASPN